jgi:hypothetical protein
LWPVAPIDLISVVPLGVVRRRDHDADGSVLVPLHRKRHPRSRGDGRVEDDIKAGAQEDGGSEARPAGRVVPGVVADDGRLKKMMSCRGSKV